MNTTVTRHRAAIRIKKDLLLEMLDSRGGNELVNKIARMDVTVWSSQAHPRFRLVTKSVLEVLDQVIEEVEKVENPIPDDRAHTAQHQAWEDCHQAVLSLLRGGAMT